jgi:hypothetical protein
MSLFRREALLDTSGTYLSDWKYIIDNGTLVGANAEATNANTTVYTVPAGKRLFVKTLTMGLLTQAAFQSIGSAKLNANHVLIQRTPAVANLSYIFSLSFTQPQKMEAAETIMASSAGNDLKVIVSFTGYTMDI